MDKDTCECQECGKSFIRKVGDDSKICPHCGSEKTVIIDIAF